jgi:hypothetical protein
MKIYFFFFGFMQHYPMYNSYYSYISIILGFIAIYDRELFLLLFEALSIISTVERVIFPENDAFVKDCVPLYVE